MPIKVRERETTTTKTKLETGISSQMRAHENKKEMRKTTTVYNRRGNYHNILNSYE